ncbi:ABC transporter ATP-binding protein [Anaerobacillus sp. CMMVII]|uniref:ABC transporter ATP-binding protein n=1 Tax=Anaerobacillus sp. CMMVII TaxID=2755588 RepID=UPI0021B77752|nr:ABC transporter ATP-binding protein [Anaerobacillus sp. CMMVII]MCT8137030.1 ABC transporter ATP-binding protein [Anaerobacillus sp. CMMVII]
MRTSLIDTSPVLQIKGLSIKNKQNKQQLLHSLDLTINPGEMVGLVGESGSGKSITASAILGLLPRQLEINQGEISFQGNRIDHLPQQRLRPLRGRHMAMIFQDYNGSLTPFIKIGKQMIETLRIHEKITKKEARERALEALQRVKLPETRVFENYPFELSGGQKQRVAIAMAMMLHPALLIADEPTTALDVVTGERILELIKDLQSELKCGVLLISHHLGEVLKWSDRIAVMYGGHLVEEGTTRIVGQHPYTSLLLQSRPQLTNEFTELKLIPGEPGNVSELGCPFVNRCPSRVEKCWESNLKLVYLQANHRVSCHLFDRQFYCNEVR